MRLFVRKYIKKYIFLKRERYYYQNSPLKLPSLMEFFSIFFFPCLKFRGFRKKNYI